jgi:dienelactone hydrolase
MNLKRKEVDAQKTAAIGYCFGGTKVLDWRAVGRQWLAWSAFTVGRYDGLNPDR